ncbi:MAG TPA: hypothetical protein VHX44_02270, partial [Planctomycetota bacterium]|nr:hypothetical protein [Planctomycetota bacterium]
MQDDSWQEHLAAEHGELAAPTLAFVQHFLQVHAGEPGIAARAAADLRSFLSACIDPTHMLGLWAQDTASLNLLLRLGSISRYGFHVACRHPGDFTMIVREEQHRQVWGNRLLFTALLAEMKAAPDRNQERRVLSRFKHRHFLRLILGDLAGAIG